MNNPIVNTHPKEAKPGDVVIIEGKKLDSIGRKHISWKKRFSNLWMEFGKINILF
ncbi:hypothetical protein GCM10007199_39930 [Fictibacillus barbaricus]|nr:hypothetical protein GCM10007199_39930 [Fictibacillus barbaricus]